MKKTLLALCCVSSLVFGTDDMDSLFDESFEDTEFLVEEPKKEKKSYNLTFNGFIKVRGYGFVNPTDVENQDTNLYHSDTILELNTKFKKDSYIVSGSVFGLIGTDSDTYEYDKLLNEPRDNDKKMVVAGIKELYAIKSADNYDIVAGKKMFNPGISTLYSPSDVYNTKLSPDPLDPYTIGTLLVKTEYYLDNSSYALVLFPYISTSKTASMKTRWGGDGEDVVVNSFTVDDAAKVTKDEENKVRALFTSKFNTILYNQGIDLLFSVGYGPSIYSVLEYTNTPNLYLETNPKAMYIDTGFSTTYKKFELHAEVYYQSVFKDKDDDFISAVGGVTYTLDKFVDKVGFKKIDMTVEYVKETITNHYDKELTYRSSEKTRAPKNDVLINMMAQINDKWNLTYFGNFRLEVEQEKDSGRYQKIASTYKSANGINTTLFVELFNGDVNSYYGKWRNNDRVGIDLKYSF